jgi:hypothetical protein
VTNISERLTVHLPECEASDPLAAFLAEDRVAEAAVRAGFNLSTTMNAILESLAARFGGVSFYSLQWIGDRHPTYSVTWPAKIMGIFPQFTGALAVEALETNDAFGLILSGNYQPPFGNVGTLFDSLLGRRVAEDCARGVLQSIADHVERRCVPKSGSTQQPPLRRDPAAKRFPVSSSDQHCQVYET